MSSLPPIPHGTGAHPIAMVSIAAQDLAASQAFYAKVFGWPMQALGPELVAAAPPAGPSVVLRGNLPAGFQGAVPFIDCADVAAMLDRVVAAGGSVERAPWAGPMGAKLARFTDPSGTIYGLATGMLAAKPPRIEMPFGTNPKPPADKTIPNGITEPPASFWKPHASPPISQTAQGYIGISRWFSQRTCLRCRCTIRSIPMEWIYRYREFRLHPCTI